MQKQTAKAEYNNFVKGLITEASPLNFPENASFDEENFVLSRKGTRARRKGMALETGAISISGSSTAGELRTVYPNAFIWEGANGNTGSRIAVVQDAFILKFFSYNADPISGTLLGTSVLIFPGGISYSFTVVDDTLVVAAGQQELAFITYNGSAFSVEYKRLLTRDVWGVEETFISQYETDISYRGSLGDQHIYNLQNQSWGIPRRNSAAVKSDPITLFFAYNALYPSNSETVWPGLQQQPVSGATTPYERIFENLYDEVLGSDSKAPKGYFIIDLLNRGASRVTQTAANNVKYPDLDYSSTPVLPVDSTPNGAAIVTSFAGRVWYAGFSGSVTGRDKRSPNLGNYIFFSQLVKNKQDFVKCYQEGDPTSRENSDVVDTDGGFVRIHGMNKIIGMLNLGTHLIVIADNGTWAISGGSDFGFSATNLKVDKLSTFGGVGRNSIVENLGRGFFWGIDGIYAISKNQFGEFGVQSATETTIQTLYNSFNTETKERAVGIFDKFEKKIIWLYKTGSLFTDTSKTYELTLDTVLGAFTKNRIYSPTDFSVEVLSLLPPMYETQQVRYVVFTDYTNEAVILNYTFALYNNTDFRDWPHISTGTDAFAYLITGDQTGGDSSVAKYLPYLTVHFYRTEENVGVDLIPLKQSGCLMRCRWEWSDSILSDRWSRFVQIYRYNKPKIVTGPSDDYDTGFRLITTKNKVRGRGKSFALYFETEPYKDCQIVGWNVVGQSNEKT